MMQNNSLITRFSRYLISAMLVVVGVIHLLPLSGVLGSEQLNSLYGLAIDEPNIEILMRHRAVLFGILGTFFVLAAFRPKLQSTALWIGFVSVLSFLWLAWSVAAYNPQVGRVFFADVVALVCLNVAAIAVVILKKTKQNPEVFN